MVKEVERLGRKYERRNAKTCDWVDQKGKRRKTLHSFSDIYKHGLYVNHCLDPNIEN